VWRGRPRGKASSSNVTRAQILTSVLEAAGEPLHYTMIHERVMQTLPPERHYPKERTYAALFYSDNFQLLGGGVFALSTWELTGVGASGDRILHHCPQPLLPDNANARSFFESVMVGRELLKREPSLAARSFYAEMQAWARKDDNNRL